MIIKLYQINSKRDTKKVVFENYERTCKMLGSTKIDNLIYDLVFTGDVEAKTLEDVYSIFNTQRPEYYTGRSVSTSDVIEVAEGTDKTEPGFYFCDDIGYKKIDFKEKEDYDIITIIQVNPFEKATTRTVDTSLETMQHLVGGYIEICCFTNNDNVIIICNEEGKYNGLSRNRILRDDNGELLDIIFGSFFVVGVCGDGFVSLTEAQQKKYLEMFNKRNSFAML